MLSTPHQSRTPNMNKSLALPLTLIALGLIVLSGVLYVNKPNNAIGAGYLGFAVTQQFATTTTVGPEATKAVTIFSETADASCHSRVVGTKNTPITILFGDPSGGNLSSTTHNASTGFVQGASTTVAYDAGVFGCGKWTATSSVSTTITVAEF